MNAEKHIFSLTFWFRERARKKQRKFCETLLVSLIPAKMLRHFQEVTLHAVRAASKGGDALRRVDGAGPALRPASGQGLGLAKLGKLAKFKILQIFGGIVLGCIFLFFARKYAFDSIFQNLPDSQAEIFEIWQKNLQNLRHLQNFAEFSRKLLIFQTDFLRKF